MYERESTQMHVVNAARSRTRLAPAGTRPLPRCRPPHRTALRPGGGRGRHFRSKRRRHPPRTTIASTSPMRADCWCRVRERGRSAPACGIRCGTPLRNRSRDIPLPEKSASTGADSHRARKHLEGVGALDETHQLGQVVPHHVSGGTVLEHPVGVDQPPLVTSECSEPSTRSNCPARARRQRCPGSGCGSPASIPVRMRSSRIERGTARYSPSSHRNLRAARGHARRSRLQRDRHFACAPAGCHRHPTR